MSGKRKRASIKIAVFSGGRGSTLSLFQSALDRYRSKHLIGQSIVVEYMTNSKVREDTTGAFRTASDLIHWLIDSDAHFIVSQGIWLGMVSSELSKDGWNVDEIDSAVRQLKNSQHNGYPFGEELDCPVWGGDKMGYISLIPEYVIPSMKVNLRDIDENPAAYVALAGAMQRYAWI